MIQRMVHVARFTLEMFCLILILLAMKKLFFLVALLLVATGCGGADPSLGGSYPTMPADFAFEYNWQEGSVPPPNHYEYTIKLDKDGNGTLIYRPDYAQNKNVPTWEEKFTVGPEERQVIFWRIADTKVFKKGKIDKEEKTYQVGGEYSWLDIMANGKKYQIGSVADDIPAVGYLYERIQRLAPGSVWQKMGERRKEYIESFEKS